MSALPRVILLLAAAAIAASALLAAAGASAGRSVVSQGWTEVVVTLPAPPLALAARDERSLLAATRHRKRLNLRAPESVSYLRQLARAQRRLQHRVEAAIPGARVRWHYSVVLDAIAVVVPRAQLARLAEVPGVARVYPSYRYHALLDHTVKLIGAPTVWGPTLATAGNGIKIGIIDDGVDQTHPFFDPSGFTYPAGFPKGNRAFTTPKVIVARAFAPPSPKWKYAARPVDPVNSDHATHVAGIAAGDHDVMARTGSASVLLSGVAPNAYIGNYKVLTIPTRDFGIDGNSPEIAAGIEAAVKDGMDVINLSLGEPEIAPGRDIVVKAIEAAAEAGVVPTISAGNEYNEFGRGYISSPATAPDAITVAASTSGRDGPADVIVDFSSSGPTALSHEMKPDVTAPGESVLSSLPQREGLWGLLSGTSMAAPHVAGAAAILLQRHPDWTVRQIKSALESTGDPVYTTDRHTTEAASVRQGGGRVDLPRADNPLLFTAPTGLAFGLMAPGSSRALTITATPAGSAPPGTWNVSVRTQQEAPDVSVTAPPTLTVPGSLRVEADVARTAATPDVTGFVVLTQGTEQRRIPFWLAVSAPRLGRDPSTPLTRPGLHNGNTAGKPSRVSRYRYPEGSSGLPATLAGPEQVFRVTLRRPTANFGVVVVSRRPGVAVSPRLVQAGNEDRLLGAPGLPMNINPYSPAFAQNTPVVGAVLPAAGTYDVVFDTPRASKAGPFAFRFWVDDTTPPRARLVTPSVPRGGQLAVRVSDGGSGVDPASIFATIDGRTVRTSLEGGRALVSTARIGPGAHTLVFHVSDYQEAKNMENTGPILPNTRTLRVRFRVL
ncbi:MAG TPA: S8 family serine peptidase [Gaiellaceae bacterium]